MQALPEFFKKHPRIFIAIVIIAAISFFSDILGGVWRGLHAGRTHTGIAQVYQQLHRIANEQKNALSNIDKDSPKAMLDSMQACIDSYDAIQLIDGSKCPLEFQTALSKYKDVMQGMKDRSIKVRDLERKIMNATDSATKTALEKERHKLLDGGDIDEDQIMAKAEADLGAIAKKFVKVKAAP